MSQRGGTNVAYELQLEELSKYFHLPIAEAAKEIGVCATVLKKICRKNNIPRWPHRKIKSINKMISVLESSMEKNPQDLDHIKEEIKTLIQHKEFVMKNPDSLVKNNGKRKRDSFTGKKSKHYDHSKKLSKAYDSEESTSSSDKVLPSIITNEFSSTTSMECNLYDSESVLNPYFHHTTSDEWIHKYNQNTTMEHYHIKSQVEQNPSFMLTTFNDIGNPFSHDESPLLSSGISPPYHNTNGFTNLFTYNKQFDQDDSLNQRKENYVQSSLGDMSYSPNQYYLKNHELLSSPYNF